MVFVVGARGFDLVEEGEEVVGVYMLDSANSCAYSTVWINPVGFVAEYNFEFVVNSALTNYVFSTMVALINTPYSKTTLEYENWRLWRLEGWELFGVRSYSQSRLYSPFIPGYFNFRASIRERTLMHQSLSYHDNNDQSLSPTPIALVV
jgi:hypothetical protein